MRLTGLRPEELDLALRAAQDPEIQEAVRQSESLERLREVRRLLRERFPEVHSLPNHKGGALSFPATAELHIAKLVVEVLKHHHN